MMLMESYLSHHCYDVSKPLPRDVRILDVIGRSVIYVDENTTKHPRTIVAVRGSMSSSDWVGNAFAVKAPLRTPHGTIYGHGGHILTARATFAKESQLSWRGLVGLSPTFCGHSSGGSMATVLALLIGRPRYSLVTFGQPRFSTATELWRAMGEPGQVDYTRVVNGSDAVPRYPWPLGFSHAGRLMYFRNDGVLVPDAGVITRGIDRLNYPFTERLTDHSAYDYFTSVWRHYYGKSLDPSTFVTG